MILRTVMKQPKTTRALTTETKVTTSNTPYCYGLKSCSAPKVPLPKPAYVQARLKFPRSDVAKFELFGINSGRIMINGDNYFLDLDNKGVIPKMTDISTSMIQILKDSFDQWLEKKMINKVLKQQPHSCSD
uniref:Uncharacterized protein n=1 Tax=Oryzias melastigma TaxID=30732 RepID=A0A3B3C984_ORYME